MDAQQRRYDIDWLRVIAIALLLIYHIAIGFQPWGIFIGFITNKDTLEPLWVPMSALNVWRIPLLFFVSGMGVYFAIQRRTWKQLLTERARRILLPFMFGVAIVVPLHVYIWQLYYHQPFRHPLHASHLWFLGNILVYTSVMAPLFFYLKNKPLSSLSKFLKALCQHPFALVVFIIPFVLEVVLVNPESFEVYAYTYHGFWNGFVAFFIGFCWVYAGKTLWERAAIWWWVFLTLALSLFVWRALVFELKSPDILMATESVFWIYAIFGVAYRWLNKPSKTLRYCSEAAYPVYIVHMFFLYLGSYWLFGYHWHPLLKYFLLLVFTFVGCLLFYELFIRRIGFMRPLFGLKPKVRDKKVIELEKKPSVQ